MGAAAPASYNSPESQLSPTERFRKYLQDGQYRITPERFEVLDAVLAWDDHFDADNLFIYLKSKGSKVSRATVYKTLNLLHECGLVSRYRFSQGHAQYEKTTGRPSHDHMVCTKCGKIVEFQNPEVERIQAESAASYGFTPSYHSLQIFGTCQECTAANAVQIAGLPGKEHAVQSHAIPPKVIKAKPLR
jgi:Fur family transcriptional regulator, ferric uptake regulator